MKKPNKDELELNTRVILKRQLKEGIEVFQSRIEDISEQYVALAMPTRGGEIVPLQVGEKIEVNFTRDDGLYVFQGPILSRKRDPVPMVLINNPRQIKREQRRQYVRVETCIPIWLRRLTGSEYLDLYAEDDPELKLKLTPPDELQLKTEENDQVTHQGIVHNISGGGMLLVSPEKFSLGELLKLRFSLVEEQERIELITRVVRSYELSMEDTSYPFSLGLEFLKVDPKGRHRIIRYTFQRQIELRRKGVV